MRRLYWRIRSWPSRWRSTHPNARCDACGYRTHQTWFRREVLRWNACPACWEDGGVLRPWQPRRLSHADRLARRRGRLSSRIGSES